MKYGIIAAGEGSRLAAEGVVAPKPLVKIGGEALIDRLIKVFLDNDAESVAVICNERMTDVAAHLERIARNGLDGRTVPLHCIVKSTPSSMHSFYEISRYLGEGPFCVTTVDTIFRADEFAGYICAFASAVKRGDCEGMMGVTDFVDDEKPLYVETDNSLNITGFIDSSDTCRYISGGIYGLTPFALETLEACLGRGESRMRNFQRALVADGARLKAYPFSKVLDVDHAGDITKAEEFICGRWMKDGKEKKL